MIVPEALFPLLFPPLSGLMIGYDDQLNGVNLASLPPFVPFRISSSATLSLVLERLSGTETGDPPSPFAYELCGIHEIITSLPS